MGEKHEDKQTGEDHEEEDHKERYDNDKRGRTTRRRITRRGMTTTNGGLSRVQTETIITDREKVQETITTMRRMRRNGKELNMHPAERYTCVHRVKAVFNQDRNVSASNNRAFCCWN
jgi:hypothetical protein